MWTSVCLIILKATTVHTDPGGGVQGQSWLAFNFRLSPRTLGGALSLSTARCAQNQHRKPGPGTGSIIKQPKEIIYLGVPIAPSRRHCIDVEATRGSGAGVSMCQEASGAPSELPASDKFGPAYG